MHTTFILVLLLVMILPDVFTIPNIFSFYERQERVSVSRYMARKI
jgi:hypothetical protein